MRGNNALGLRTNVRYRRLKIRPWLSLLSIICCWIFVPDSGLFLIATSWANCSLPFLVGRKRPKNGQFSNYNLVIQPCVIIYWQNYLKTVAAFKALQVDLLSERRVMSTDLPGTLLFDYSKFATQTRQVFGRWSYTQALLPWWPQWRVHFLWKKKSFGLLFVWTNKNVIASWKSILWFPASAPFINYCCCS